MVPREISLVVTLGRSGKSKSYVRKWAGRLAEICQDTWDLVLGGPFRVNTNKDIVGHYSRFPHSTRYFLLLLPDFSKQLEFYSFFFPASKPTSVCSQNSPSSFLRIGSLVAQTVKNLPAMQEIWVPSLGWEDPLAKGRAIHSSILAWRIPWTEELGGLLTIGSQTIRHYWATNTITTIW